MYQQVYEPIGDLAISTLIAVIPIVVLFVLLAGIRVASQWASLVTLAVALVIAIVVYGMPVGLALNSTLLGICFGLFPIVWIVLNAIFIYVIVDTGHFDTIRDYLASVSNDRRIQVVLIAFVFGALLEATAGFGTPVAITGSLMAGLGFEPLYAAALALLANTAPVAFGGFGIPIITGASVAGLDLLDLSQMVGRQTPLLALIIPRMLVTVMAGFRQMLQVWPVVVVSGVSFAGTQFLVSNLLGPELADLLAALAAVITVIALLAVWRPREKWHFESGLRHPSGRATIHRPSAHPLRRVALHNHHRAVPDRPDTPHKGHRGSHPDGGELPHRGAQRRDRSARGALARPERTGRATAAGGSRTDPLLGGLRHQLALGGRDPHPDRGHNLPRRPQVGPGRALRIYGQSFNQLKWAILTIASILGLAYLLNYSGMTFTMGLAFASTGFFYVFFASFIGWLGVALTGSDTSSNALFSDLQKVTAQQIGVSPILTVGANSSGGVLGKMISPQNLAVGTSATGLQGREGDLLRLVLKWSIGLTIVMSILVVLQATILNFMVP